MMRRRIPGSVLMLLPMAAAGAAASAAASVDNPLGVYLGASLGQADVRDNQIVLGGTPAAPVRYDFHEHDRGWKATLGIRPITLLGAELEYFDFGRATAFGSFQGQPFQETVSERGPALFGVGYLPLPVPRLDVFGKAGAIRLEREVSATPTPGFGTTRTEFAYGAGAQIDLWVCELRLEYERVKSSGGDPDLLSIGFTWSY